MHERNTGIFIDAENLIGGYGGATLTFDVGSIVAAMSRSDASTLMRRTLVARAYASWSRPGLNDLRRQMRQLAIEAIHVEGAAVNDRNASDLHLAVDLLGLAFETPALEVVVLVSGDGGLTPLVRKLQLLGRYVLGLSREDAASGMLKSACDEFIELSPARAAAAAQGPMAPPKAQPSWESVVLDVVTIALADTKSISLARVDASLRERLNVRSLAEFHGQKSTVRAIAAALANTPYTVYRMPDVPAEQFITRLSDAPDAAIFSVSAAPPRDSSASEQVPVFRGSPSGDVGPLVADDQVESLDASRFSVFRSSAVDRISIVEREAHDPN